MPWQQALADVAYEYDPTTGLFRYDEVDVTVPRQSGKTTLVLAKKVHRLTVMPRRYGPQRSTYTAQTRLKARQKLEKDFAELLRASRSFREVPNAKARPGKPAEWRLTLNNGSESIQFGRASFLQIDAPSRTGGHGDTLDDGTIDEAFAQEDDTVEGGMRPSMATRRNAQLWVISTAGDSRSKYLWRKVLAGRAAAESGEHGRVCCVEYSAPDDADPGDPATWWSCMPALGITVPEEFVRGEWQRAQRKGQEGVDMFRRAYLNQWPEIPMLEDGAGFRVIPADRWAGCAAASVEFSGAPLFALDVSLSRERAWIGLAVPRLDGRVQVELLDSESGVAWVARRLAELCSTYRTSVVLDGSGPAAALLPDLEAAPVPVTALPRSEVVQACGAFLDAVNEGTVSHLDDPILTEAVGAAQLRPGESVVWTRKGTADISPLYAVTLACWGWRTRAGSSDILQAVW